MRGYFGIGMWHPKTEYNLGGLWRSAYNFDAAFIFTIGARYRHQSSDVPNTPRHIPLYSFETFEQFQLVRPYDCQLIAVELCAGARPLETFDHPERAIYLLGGEDKTLPESILSKCQHRLIIDTPLCLNVASCGTVVMYDRHAKGFRAADLAKPIPLEATRELQLA